MYVLWMEIHLNPIAVWSGKRVNGVGSMGTLGNSSNYFLCETLVTSIE